MATATKTAPISAAPAKKAKINKSAWIRSQSASMTASEVVAKAKGQGIKLSPAFVYVVRSKKSKPGAKRGPGRPRKNAAPAMAAAHSGAEGLLKAAAAEVGLSRAMEILSEQRDAVRRVLGG
jgi:hypothetical protein